MLGHDVQVVLVLAPGDLLAPVAVPPRAIERGLDLLPFCPLG